MHCLEQEEINDCINLRKTCAESVDWFPECRLQSTIRNIRFIDSGCNQGHGEHWKAVEQLLCYLRLLIIVWGKMGFEFLYILLHTQLFQIQSS